MRTLRISFLVLSVVVGAAAQCSLGSSKGLKTRLDTVRVSRLTLKNQTLSSGLSRLASDWKIRISMEGLPSGKNSPSPRSISASFEGGTLLDAINWLVAQDPAYAWSADGDIVNVVPLRPPTPYLLGRVVPRAEIKSARNVAEVLSQIHATEGRETIAILSGNGMTFAEPLSRTYLNCTVRELLNRTVQALGPTHGWSSGSYQTYYFLQIFSKPLAPDLQRPVPQIELDREGHPIR